MSHPAAALALAALLGLCLLLPGLGAAPFDDPGEGQHAEIAREAWAEGAWLTPRLNGVRYFDKPPLLYWLTAVSFGLLGPSESVARLVPLLGALLAVTGVVVLGAELLGPRAGFIAGATLLSCALFSVFARYLRPETLFVAAIQWGFTGLLLGARRSGSRPGRWWALLGCASLGLAALAKDVLGLVGPVAAVALALALGGRARPLSGWIPRAGLALLGLLGFGWYAAAAAANPGFLWYTVVDNHVLNAARLRHFPDEDVPLSALEFLAVGSLGAFPWIIPALLMVIGLARARAWRSPAEMPWVALGLWASAVFIVFAVVPFRLPHYGLPAYPAVALLAARWWQERGEGRAGVPIHLAALAPVAIACAVAASSDGRGFTEAVFGAADVYTRKEVALGEASPYPEWSLLQPLVGRTALILGAGSAGLLLAAILGAKRMALWVVTAAMLLCVPLATAGAGHVASARAVSALAADVEREMRPGDLLVHEGPIENSGALEFYSGRRPILLDGKRSVLGIGATFPEASDVFWDRERFRREWLSGRRILLVTPRAPAGSVVAMLPPESVRLLSVRNGRWLHATAVVPVSRRPARSDPGERPLRLARFSGSGVR